MGGLKSEIGHLLKAVRAWRSALGSSRVRLDRTERAIRETATYLTRNEVLAVLLPRSVEEVQACVRIANRHGIPLHPISGGRNYGYGSQVPNARSAVVLDLRMMRKITAYDPELGFARVQPGVTQAQLAEFLSRKGDTHWIDSTSSSPESSVLANALERGHGMTPYCDHVSQICSFEVVLPNGTLIHTGHGGKAASALSNLDAWPAGPNLDGLFSQSNLGIVTALTVWLMRKPAAYSAGFVSFPDAELKRVLDAFRELRLEHTLRSGPFLSNDVRMIQTYLPHPWEQADGTRALPIPLIRKLARSLGASAWTGAFGVYGPASLVAAAKRRVVEVLRKSGTRVSWLDHERAAQNAASAGDRHRARMMGALSGQVQEPPRRPYWRKPEGTAVTGNFDRDRCGFIWTPVTIPFRGKDAHWACRAISQVVRKHGFDPDISVVGIRERTLQIYSSIVFDRNVPGQDEQALRCQRALTDALARRGYFCHRLGLHSTNPLEHADYCELLRILKNAIDPAGILAPGRYLPRSRR